MYRKKRLWFLLLLVLLITPISYASVEVKVVGSDGFNNVARKPDSFQINITASIGEEITTSKVKIGNSNPQVCIQKTNAYICSFSASTNELQPTVHTFPVEVRNSANEVVETANAQLIIDVESPVINSIILQKNNTQVKAVINALDTACPGCGSCVGVRNLTITERTNTTILSIRKISIPQGTCAVSRTETLQPNVPNNFAGNLTICVQADDYFSQNSNVKCEMISLDNQPPEILSLEIKDSENKRIKYVGTPVSAILKITSSDPGTIMADLSPLNPSLSLTPGSCVFNNQLYCEWSLTITSPNITKRIAVNATDLEGNSELENLSFNIGLDNNPPNILSLEIIKNNRVVRYLNGPSQITLRVNVSDELLDVSSVKINLSDVSNDGRFFSTQPCMLFNMTYSCELPNVVININQTKTFRIPVQASDVLGNSVTAVGSIPVIFDNVNPSVLYLGTFRDFANKTWAGIKNNSLYAVFNESGSGFENKDVFFDVNNQVIQANNCTGRNVWLCNVDNLSFSGSVVSTRSVFDDAGNPAPDLSSTLTIDSSPPIINNITMLQDGLAADCPVNGDTVNLIVNATEESPYLGINVMTENVSSRNNFYGVCKNLSNNQWSCIVEISSVVPSQVNGSIRVILEDAGGNLNETVHNFTVCHADTITNPDFVTVILENPNTIPGQIDRKIAGLTDYLVLVPMHYNATSSVKVVRTDDDDCPLASFQLSDKYEPQLFSQFSHDPVLAFKLKKSNYQDSVNLSCGLRLRLRAGSTVYLNPEVENVNFSVAFFNNPLGSPESAVQEKLNEVNQDIKSTEDAIKSKENQLKTLKTICETARMIGKVNSILQSVKSLLWNVHLAGWSSCPAVAAGAGPGYAAALKACKTLWSSIWSFTCTTFNGFHKIVEQFIWPSGYIPEGMDAIGMFLFKYPCMVQYYCTSFEELLGSVVLEGVNQFGLGKISIGGNELYVPKHGSGVIPDSNGKWKKGKTDLDPATNEEQRKEYFDTLSDGYNIWGDVTNSVLRPGDSKLDPYKSIHLAGMCVPAQIYNLKKERQIKCLYRTCIQNHLGTGVPLTGCDTALRERECLYIEGAGAKGKGGLFSSLLGGLSDLQRVLFLVAGTAYRMYCQEYINLGHQLCTQGEPENLVIMEGAHKSNICGIAGTVITLKELMDTFQSEFGPGGPLYKKYQNLIEKNDFCGG